MMVLRRIGILSAAKISGILYAAIGLLVGLVLAGISSLASTFGPGFSPDMPRFFGAMFGVGAIIFLPIVYGVMGFIGGAIGAGVYNAFSGIVGGLELELVART